MSRQRDLTVCMTIALVLLVGRQNLLASTPLAVDQKADKILAAPGVAYNATDHLYLMVWEHHYAAHNTWNGPCGNDVDNTVVVVTETVE